MMRYLLRALSFIASLVCAGVVASAGFILLGGVLPLGAMIAIYGFDAVEGAPAHGALALFVTLPLAAFVSLLGFLFLTEKFHMKLTERFALNSR